MKAILKCSVIGILIIVSSTLFTVMTAFAEWDGYTADSTPRQGSWRFAGGVLGCPGDHIVFSNSVEGFKNDVIKPAENEKRMDQGKTETFDPSALFLNPDPSEIGFRYLKPFESRDIVIGYTRKPASLLSFENCKYTTEPSDSFTTLYDSHPKNNTDVIPEGGKVIRSGFERSREMPYTMKGRESTGYTSENKTVLTNISLESRLTRILGNDWSRVLLKITTFVLSCLALVFSFQTLKAIRELIMKA